MQLRSAISKDGSMIAVRNRAGTGMEIVQRSNAAIHPFLRGLEGMTNAAGDRLVKPFAHSVWVQRAIKRVAEPIAAVPLEFYDHQGNGDLVEIKDAGLAAFWETPGLDRSGPIERGDFIEALVGWLKLSGEYFLLLDDTWLTQRFAGAQRGRIIIARPDRMRPILQGQKLSGWEWTDAAGNRHALVPEQVVHRKFWNPYDDLRGLAEYEAAKTASEGDYLAGKFALNMNRANGDRGVIVVAKGGMPSDEQQEQIVRALREKANAARQGNFRPIFLSGDVAVEDPKISAPDANFVSSRLQNRHEIFIAFGVPPSMCDLVANYSIGSASDWYQLILQTCQPLATTKIGGGIAAVSRRMFAGGRDSLVAQFDFDDHPVMQQVRRERIDTGTKLWDRGVPWDVVNDHLDLGLPKFAGSDKGFIPFNLSEVGADGDILPSADAPSAEAASPTSSDDKSEPAENLRSLFASQSPVLLLRDAFEATLVKQIGARTPDLGSLFRGIACGGGPAQVKESRSDRDPARVKRANAHLRSRGPAIKRTKSKLTKVLMGARREVLAKLAKAGGKTVSTKAAAADYLFDLASFKKELLTEMRKAAEANLQDAGQQLLGEIGLEEDVFSMPPAAAHRFLQRRENLLSNVADSVFDEIREQLQEGIEAGDTTAQLATRVRGKFNEIDDGRALTVAQTEVGAAYGEARQLAMDEAGIEWKEWLTSGLPTVRATHEAAEGQRVRVNDAFDIGTVHLIAPGIPAGPGDDDPSEIINCHCVSIPVDGPGEEEAPKA
ncbi:MAG: phage portal protein [Chthoniobacter sp.]|nr:phage portal protein [Chthoniobacter sp.]